MVRSVLGALPIGRATTVLANGREALRQNISAILYIFTIIIKWMFLWVLKMTK